MVAAREFVTATADLVAELSDEEKAVVPKFDLTRALAGPCAGSNSCVVSCFRAGW